MCDFSVDKLKQSLFPEQQIRQYTMLFLEWSIYRQDDEKALPVQSGIWKLVFSTWLGWMEMLWETSFYGLKNVCMVTFFSSMSMKSNRWAFKCGFHHNARQVDWRLYHSLCHNFLIIVHRSLPFGISIHKSLSLLLWKNTNQLEF